MVYRLTVMPRKTKVFFFVIVWGFSAGLAILGSFFIASAGVLPNSSLSAEPTDNALNLRRDMGPLQSLEYWDPITSQFSPNVTLKRVGQEIRVTTGPGIEHDFFPQNVEETYLNGSVYYTADQEVLVFDYWNNTVIEVGAPVGSLWFSIKDRALRLHFEIGEEYEIIRRTFDPLAGETNLDERKGEIIGPYFEVTDLGIFSWLQDSVLSLYDSLAGHFLFVVQNFLFAVAVGGGIGIITAFLLILTRLSRLFGGKRVTYYMLKALNGKLGKLVSFIPFFDFKGDFYIEEAFLNDIDLSTVRSTVRELYKQRGYDVLFFPTAVASILTIFFVQNFPGEDKMLALTLAPLLTPIVLILVLPYFPQIWAFNEGGVKRVEISDQGDIIAVKPLGKILRDGLGIIIGLSGILALGALAVEVTGSFELEATSAEIQVAGFTFDIYGLAILILWTVGLFFLLLGSTIVSISVLAAEYLQNSHLETIEYLRTKSDKAGVIRNWGSVTTKFSPHAKGAIYDRRKSE